LINLSYHYPESGHNLTTLELIANDYFDDLKGEYISEETFIKAMKLCRKECQYFPKIKDVLAICGRLHNQPSSNNLQIESSTPKTDEDIARNKRKFKIISNAVANGLGSEETARLLEEDIYP